MDRSAAPSTDDRAARAGLTDAAHALSSTAGMFGFTALAVTARRFEGALATDAPEAQSLAEQVREETVAALAVLDELVKESRMLPV